MSGIVDWVKDYSMVFLLMTVLTSVAAKKEYRRYIQLFVEIILVITLMDPLLQAFGKSGDLFEKISYDSFWQGLNGIRMDREKMDFLEEDYYIGYYERAIEADAGLLAESFGYTVIEASVTLNEAYEVESMALAVAKSDTRQVIVGTVGRKPEKPEITALREKLAAYSRGTDIHNGLGGICETERFFAEKSMETLG